MQKTVATLVALAGLLAVSCGSDVASMAPVNVVTGTSVVSVSADSQPSLETPSSLTNQNATVTGNNVLVTRSNIIIISDQDKRGVVKLIKNLVMKGSSPQDDDALATQIVAVLAVSNITSSSATTVGKMMPKIKTAFQSRGKPAQLHQIIVKLTEMSPKFGATEMGDQDV